MKKQMLMMLLVVGMLIGAGGCGQQNQTVRKYKVKQIDLGYAVVIPQQKYTFSNDVKAVWQDEQFRTHIIFWSLAGSYPLFCIPFTETTPMIILP